MRGLLVGTFAVAAFTLAGSVRAQTNASIPTATYTKSPEGRIEAVTTSEGTTRYSYFDDGLIREVVYPNGSRDTFDHDEIVAAAKLVERLTREDQQTVAIASVAPVSALQGDDPFQVSGNRFAFTGYYFDLETGLYFAKARYYDPELGRFTTQDSHVGDFTDPPSLHRYMYGHNNPGRFVDPTGHSDKDANLLAAAMNKRTGFLAADRRPAEEKGWWSNFGWEVYKDLPPRLLPMRQFEGLAKQDVGEFALGTGETVVAALVAPLVRGGSAALVERFPILGRSVTETAVEAVQRLRPPAPVELPAPPVDTVTIPEIAQSNGGFVATEDGRLTSTAPRIAGGSQALDELTAPDAGIWAEKPTTRGAVAEHRLAGTEYKDWYHVGAEAKGKFPLVDFQQGNNLASLKTVDTAGKGWMRGMERHIEDLSTRGATISEEPANMILDLRVPPGGSAAAKPLVEYGRARGVTVVIKEIR